MTAKLCRLPGAQSLSEDAWLRRQPYASKVDLERTRHPVESRWGHHGDSVVFFAHGCVALRLWRRVHDGCKSPRRWLSDFFGHGWVFALGSIVAVVGIGCRAFMKGPHDLPLLLLIWCQDSASGCGSCSSREITRSYWLAFMTACSAVAGSDDRGVVCRTTNVFADDLRLDIPTDESWGAQVA
jgi:hypothetical protein